MRRLLIKVCGMSDQAALDAAGSADYCGFIFHPASPRFVTPEAAGRLDARGLARVGVFVRADLETMARTAELARLDLLQMHGDQEPDEMATARDLAQRRTGRRIGMIRVLWPARHAQAEDLAEAVAREAERYAGVTDLFLLEAGVSGGGSGHAQDPRLLAGVSLPRPWLLAGGLGSENALDATAILAQNPTFAGLDLNSGLEDAPGQKNPDKIRALLHAVRAAEPQPRKECL